MLRVSPYVTGRPQYFTLVRRQHGQDHIPVDCRSPMSRAMRQRYAKLRYTYTYYGKSYGHSVRANRDVLASCCSIIPSFKFCALRSLLRIFSTHSTLFAAPTRAFRSRQSSPFVGLRLSTLVTGRPSCSLTGQGTAGGSECSSSGILKQLQALLV